MILPWGRRGEGQRAFVLGLLRLGKCFPAPAWSMTRGEVGTRGEKGSRDGAGAGAGAAKGRGKGMGRGRGIDP